MPHNPRRQRVPEPRDVALTDAQIAEALARAVALRRRTACDPNDVHALAMTPSDAYWSTKTWRHHTHWYRRTHLDGLDGETRDPWYWIGWVRLERAWGFVDDLGWDRYDRTWEVWLNVDDGRVWLKPERVGQSPRDDPCP